MRVQQIEPRIASPRAIRRGMRAGQVLASPSEVTWRDGLAGVLHRVVGADPPRRRSVPARGSSGAAGEVVEVVARGQPLRTFPFAARTRAAWAGAGDRGARGEEQGGRRQRVTSCVSARVPDRLQPQSARDRRLLCPWLAEEREVEQQVRRAEAGAQRPRGERDLLAYAPGAACTVPAVSAPGRRRRPADGRDDAAVRRRRRGSSRSSRRRRRVAAAAAAAAAAAGGVRSAPAARGASRARSRAQHARPRRRRRPATRP